MRRVMALVLASVCALATAACTDSGNGSGPDGRKGRDGGKSSLSEKPPATVADVPTAGGTHRLKIDVGGPVPREYGLHVPPKLAKGRWTGGKPAKRLPLVLAMHGGAANGRHMEQISGFSGLADDKGFLVAYPEGFLLSWNAGVCCGPAKLSNTDDVGYLTKIANRLVDIGLADPKRLYATGFSNGAGMAYRLACEAPGKFAAIGVVAAAMKMEKCHPDPVSVLVMHGTADRSVPYNGGGRVDFNDPRPFPPVSYAIDYWRKANKLPPLRESLRGRGAMDCRSTGKGRNGAEVALCRIDGGPHRWPDAAENTLWDFFAAHPLR